MTIHKQRQERQAPRAARVGIIIGAVLGTIGALAGFYVGILRPAIDSGQWKQLPIGSLWLGGAVLITLLVIPCALVVRARARAAARAKSSDDW
jgi:Mg/Co/Ni transporter MgtE